MKKNVIQTDCRNALYDITAEVREAVRESGVKEGSCVVYCPHTTAAITINENGDPAVRGDIALGLERISPDLPQFRHMEGNSDAHIKSSLVGVSETLLIENGAPVLGTWQGIYFCEFDGPRSRKYYVKIMHN